MDDKEMIQSWARAVLEKKTGKKVPESKVVDIDTSADYGRWITAELYVKINSTQSIYYEWDPFRLEDVLESVATYLRTGQISE